MLFKLFFQLYDAVVFVWLADIILWIAQETKSRNWTWTNLVIDNAILLFEGEDIIDSTNGELLVAWTRFHSLAAAKVVFILKLSPRAHALDVGTISWESWYPRIDALSVMC